MNRRKFMQLTSAIGALAVAPHLAKKETGELKGLPLPGDKEPVFGFVGIGNPNEKGEYTTSRIFFKDGSSCTLTWNNPNERKDP